MAVIKFMVYITCFCSSQVLCDDYGESGNEITLTPIIRGKPEEILWTHNGNKVLEYDGNEVVKYGSFKDRVVVDFETGQLTIRKLNNQDSGEYLSEIWINTKVQTSSHTLTVLDALPEPLVTCEVDETSNLKKLSCSVDSQTQPSYEWSGPDIKQPGPTLLVDEQEENRDSVYTCTVKNKAASRTTDFTLRDCHTGGVNPAVLVPVLIVAVLLIILLAVLVLYLYRRKRQKCECDNLLINVPTKTMPGSSDATLPCHTRLTAPKESIADKKWDHDSESENLGKTHEGQKSLKASPQTAVTEKNKEDTGNTNEGELDKNEKNAENADKAEENANSEPDETDREIESQKTSQTQEEMEKEKSQILKNERENKDELPEGQFETREKNKNENADKSEDDQTKKEKKKEENEEMNSSNTGSSDATLPCHTRLTAPKESFADKKWDHDSESENVGDTDEGQKLLKESPQSAITEKNKEDTGNTNEGELDKNEKNAENTDEAEENANSKPDETQSHKAEDVDKNDKDQTPEEKKEMEEENKETDSTNTDSQADLEREPTNVNVAERVRHFEQFEHKMNDRK